MANGFYIGTDLKFKIEIKAAGFDMENDNFSIQLRNGDKTIDVPDDNIVSDSDGNYYLLVSTSELKSGPLTMIVTAEVPDDDFPENSEEFLPSKRREVEKINLCTIKVV